MTDHTSNPATVTVTIPDGDMSPDGFSRVEALATIYNKLGRGARTVLIETALHMVPGDTTIDELIPAPKGEPEAEPDRGAKDVDRLDTRELLDEWWTIHHRFGLNHRGGKEHELTEGEFDRLMERHDKIERRLLRTDPRTPREVAGFIRVAEKMREDGDYYDKREHTILERAAHGAELLHVQSEARG